ncbi:MAG: PaaI family thioesterase [Solirubrobacteraceae bacterium]
MNEPPGGFEPITDEGAFVQHIGPLLGREGVVGLRIDGRHTNSFGKAQGGVLATLVDFANAHNVRRENGDDGIAVATVSLTVDYLGAASEGDWVEAHVTVERLGGTLAFVDCSVRSGDREIVRGRAVFAVLS